MIERTISVVAVLCSVIVVLGFGLFALDEVRDASERQQALLAQDARAVAPSSTAERVRERTHNPAREAIDDANDILLRPFAGLSTSDDPWLARLVPALVGLLFYGFGFGLLASWLRDHLGRAPLRRVSGNS